MQVWGYFSDMLVKANFYHLIKSKEVEMKKQLLFVAAVFFITLISAASAHAIPVQRLTITEGGFSGFGPAVPGRSDYNPFSTINMDIIMGTFQGSPVFDSNGDADPTAGIASIQFINFDLTGVVFTTSTAYGYDPPLAGQNPAPSGDVSDGVLTLNLESWAGFQDGEGIFNAVPAYDVYYKTTYNPITHEYTADWASYPVPGPWDIYQYWHLEGVVHLVPEPGSLLLVGSGLAGLWGVAKRMRR